MTTGDFRFKVEPSNRITFYGDWTQPLSTTMRITNKSRSTQAFKVKCSSNALFKIRPPFGILDFNESVDIHISFKVYHIPAPEETTAKEAWAAHDGPPQGEKKIKVAFDNV